MTGEGEPDDGEFAQDGAIGAGEHEHAAEPIAEPIGDGGTRILDASVDGGALHAPVPEALNRNLRCCVTCRLLKTLEQFYQQGCENCTFLDLEGDRERIEDCTTTEFQGMLGVIDPSGSWATRYAFIQGKRVPGVYALSVDQTNLRPHIRELLEDNGVKLQS
jgi:transcription elongation factor SPT4